MLCSEKWQGNCFYQKARKLVNIKNQELQIRQSDNSEVPLQAFEEVVFCAKLCEDQPECHAFDFKALKCRLYKDGDLSPVLRTPGELNHFAGFCLGKKKQLKHGLSCAKLSRTDGMMWLTMILYSAYYWLSTWI